MNLIFLVNIQVIYLFWKIFDIYVFQGICDFHSSCPKYAFITLLMSVELTPPLSFLISIIFVFSFSWSVWHVIYQFYLSFQKSSFRFIWFPSYWFSDFKLIDLCFIIYCFTISFILLALGLICSSVSSVLQ